MEGNITNEHNYTSVFRLLLNVGLLVLVDQWKLQFSKVLIYVYMYEEFLRLLSAIKDWKVILLINTNINLIKKFNYILILNKYVPQNV